MAVSYWIVRTTLDIFNECHRKNVIGASKSNVGRLRRLKVGDKGVFYISSKELFKSGTLSELRAPFVCCGPAAEKPLDVPTVPQEKRITHTSPVTFASTSRVCDIREFIDQLQVIKKKDHWGSYLMQPFIEISSDDYACIISRIG